MHGSSIKIPDGNKNQKGVDASLILNDWSEKELSEFLMLPIFDEEIYGTVRFHHRSVREYLTARWLSDKLQSQGFKKAIESLFFQKKYGEDVVVPSMRLVLSWMILLDEGIRQKALQVDPEIFLEGGDPSRLPLPVRERILEDVCKNISLKLNKNSTQHYGAVQRFAKKDIAGTVKNLLDQYSDDNDVISFLMKLIWQGNIYDLLGEVKNYAFNLNAEKYTRIWAIRTLKEIGSQQDFLELLKSISLEPDGIDRSIASELVENIEPDSESIDCLFKIFTKIDPREESRFDHLANYVADFSKRLSGNYLYSFIKSVNDLLDEEPYVEKRFFEVSEKHLWLITSAGFSVKKLIESRDEKSIENESLSILSKIFVFDQNVTYENRDIIDKLVYLVSGWPELNYKLYWYIIHVARTTYFDKNEKRLIYHWQGSMLGLSQNFSINDFHRVVLDIENKQLMDDKLVALSLAFSIYKDNSRPRRLLTKLKNSIKALGIDELNDALHDLLHPKPLSDEEKKYRRQSSRWKRQSKQRQEKEKIRKQEWLDWLNANLEHLSDGEHIDKGVVSKPYAYLYKCLQRVSEKCSRWADGDWRLLVTEFGTEIAEAFRDGVIKFWRNYKPSIASEADKTNQTPYAVIIGLVGLDMESKYNQQWIDLLTDEEVILACRYAFRELNGFPKWFSSLYKSYPDKVGELVIREIEWELSTETSEHQNHYILSKLSWSGCSKWDYVVRNMLTQLEQEPKNYNSLCRILVLLHSNEAITNDELASLAFRKLSQNLSLTHMAVWFAVWVGVEPDKAIEKLSCYLSNIDDREEATDFAKNFIVHLLGDRRNGLYVREEFLEPEYLKSLYMLMHEYILIEDDINRSGGGVYSPTLRDDAQDARNRLFDLLKNIPGKKSYLSMMELYESHPVDSYRSWMLYNARERAEIDAELPPLSISQFIDFSNTIEYCPANHKQLFDIALQRLEDFKNNLEQGDTSISTLLKSISQETEVRKYIANWLRERSANKYSVPQEEELADAKRPDIRFHGMGFDEPVPVELKLADNWSANDFFERLKNQLCSDYLRDEKSNMGIFLLVYRGKQKFWKAPEKVNFSQLVEKLQQYWFEISTEFEGVNYIKVVGIDLTFRSGNGLVDNEA